MKGILKVELVDARDLNDTDLIGKMDPYVLIQYKDQNLKSKVAKGQGSNPVWKDKFSFWVEYPKEEEDYILVLKIMDKDTFTFDDFIGEVRINLKDLVVSGIEKGTAELQPWYYSVMNKNHLQAGEIQIAFTFNLKQDHEIAEGVQEEI